MRPLTSEWWSKAAHFAASCFSAAITIRRIRNNTTQHNKKPKRSTWQKANIAQRIPNTISRRSHFACIVTSIWRNVWDGNEPEIVFMLQIKSVLSLYFIFARIFITFSINYHFICGSFSSFIHAVVHLVAYSAVILFSPDELTTKTINFYYYYSINGYSSKQTTSTSLAAPHQ